jgi:hypothetical protein
MVMPRTMRGINILEALHVWKMAGRFQFMGVQSFAGENYNRDRIPRAGQIRAWEAEIRGLLRGKQEALRASIGSRQFMTMKDRIR